MVYTITEVKTGRVLGILRDDSIATLQRFLSKLPENKVKEVCIDMKDGLIKAVEGLFPLVRVAVGWRKTQILFSTVGSKAEG